MVFESMVGETSDEVGRLGSQAGSGGKVAAWARPPTVLDAIKPSERRAVRRHSRRPRGPGRLADLPVVEQEIDELRHLDVIDGDLGLVCTCDDQVLLLGSLQFQTPSGYAINGTAGEISAREIRLQEGGTLEDRSDEVRSADVRPTEVRLAEVCPAEPRLVEIRLAQICAAEIRAPEVRVAKVRPA
jgi:hypothetical protein